MSSTTLPSSPQSSKLVFLLCLNQEGAPSSLLSHGRCPSTWNAYPHTSPQLTPHSSRPLPECHVPREASLPPSFKIAPSSLSTTLFAHFLSQHLSLPFILCIYLYFGNFWYRLSEGKDIAFSLLLPRASNSNCHIHEYQKWNKNDIFMKAVYVYVSKIKLETT